MKFRLSSFSTIFLAFALAITTNPASAFEVTAESKIVDDIESISDGDWYGGRDLKFVEPTSIALEVSSGGGCRVHEYVLHISRKIKESFPPVVEAKLTLDKNGDPCKAIVTDAVTFDFADLGLSGPNILEISMGEQQSRILIDVKGPEQPKAAVLLQLKAGAPSNFGDQLFSLDNAFLISGVVGNTLTVDVTYSGGCQEHMYEAFWDGSYDKSFPPRANIILVHHNNGDVCRSLVEDKIQIGVDDVVTGQPDVVLVVHSLNLPSKDAVKP